LRNLIDSGFAAHAHSSWRRRTGMKPFLNVFRKFSEIKFGDSRFRLNDDAVWLDVAAYESSLARHWFAYAL